MSSSDYWDAATAARYDETSAFMFEPDVLDPAVDFLASLASEAPALEFAIGTGRVALPRPARILGVGRAPVRAACTTIPLAETASPTVYSVETKHLNVRHP